jgi:RHS repeat-associated protein
VRSITNQDQEEVARHDFLPFGEEWSATSFANITSNVRFAGLERDPETGLDYAMARYYRPQSGRFTTVDPGHVNGNSFDSQSWNGYGYARNNSLRYVDPTGTEYEICAFDSSGRTSTCGTVSDQYFNQLHRNPGAGIQLWGGAIFVGDRRVGYYMQTSIDPTFDDFARQTGRRADALLKAGTIAIGASAIAGGTGGLALGMLSGGLGTGGLVALGGETGMWTGGAINQVIGQAQRNLLRSFLRDGHLPTGLERRTLELYRMVAKQYLAEQRGNAAGITEQTRRLRIIEQALKRLR